MELELGLAPPNTDRLVEHLDELSSTAAATCGKRGFREAFQKTATTLPLFDDGSNTKRKRPLVGWPPVSSARRAGERGANYVKVKKEGVAIGRKVDLSLHASYDELLATLARMFPATNSQGDKEIRSDDHHCRGRRHVVTYEDGDGDWMLVGDVPWDDFARSVKRLKIMGN